MTFSDPTWVRKDVSICLLLTRRNPNYVSDEKGDSIKRSSQPQSFALAFRGLGAEPTNKLLQKLLTLHCLPLLSRIRDKIGYPEKSIIPKREAEPLSHKDSLQHSSG